MEAARIRVDSEMARPVRRLRVTQRRIDANRRNATHSTGPRTPEGKAKVRLNALRHGFRARDELCLEDAGEEARRWIAALSEELSRDLRAAGPQQRALVAEIAHASWKQKRALELSEQERWWEWPQRPAERKRLMAFMDALTSYESKADRQFHRAFNALDKLRRASLRENQRTKPPARHGRASGPERSEGPQPHPDHRLTSALQANIENQRTKPLARHGRASGPERSEGSQRHPDHWLRLVQPPNVENRRTKPLAVAGSPAPSPVCHGSRQGGHEPRQPPSPATEWGRGDRRAGERIEMSLDTDKIERDA